MVIEVEHIGKRFRRQWVFQGLSHRFEDLSCWAISGPNGSGKSTLLKILSGYSSPTKGQVTYWQQDTKVPEDQMITQFGFVGPYQQLIEELTLREHIDFHFQFRQPTIEVGEMMERAGLSKAKSKYVHEFSSGMKQRLRLLLAFFAKGECLFLDEPTANLDEYGIKWYEQEVLQIKGKRNIIIASNQRYEYAFTDQILPINEFEEA